MTQQLGRICMDMYKVGLSELPKKDAGSEVERFGPACGISALSAAGSISFELLYALSKRIPRSAGIGNSP